MFPMKNTVLWALAMTPLTIGTAFASSPDEFTLEPVIGNSQTATTVTQTETYSTNSGSVTIQPVTTTTTPGTNEQFQEVDINNYIIQDNTNQ